jgi:ATP-dependent RNA helicase DBP3
MRLCSDVFSFQQVPSYLLFHSFSIIKVSSFFSFSSSLLCGWVAQQTGNDDANNKSHSEKDNEISDFPSKFVFWCLSTIENALRHDDAYTDGEGNSFFLNSWGLEFSKCFPTGKNLMDTGGTFATTEQIAWMVSAAADTFVRKEKQDISIDTPFLLFLVPSEKKAVQVR